MPSSHRPTATATADAQTLQELFAAVVALTHALTRAAQQLHGGGELTAGLRGVLTSLRREGPLTVPQLARMRPVSRQHIQIHVNALLKAGYVTRVENPAHRRSRLVAIAPRGERLLTAMRAREDQAFGALQLSVSRDDLRQTLDVLHALRPAVLQLKGPAGRGRTPRRPPRQAGHAGRTNTRTMHSSPAVRRRNTR